jgi:hypothetical protein
LISEDGEHVIMKLARHRASKKSFLALKKATLKEAIYFLLLDIATV